MGKEWLIGLALVGGLIALSWANKNKTESGAGAPSTTQVTTKETASGAPSTTYEQKYQQKVEAIQTATGQPLPEKLSGYNTKSLLAGGKVDPYAEAEARKLENEYTALQRRMIAIKQSGNWNLDLYNQMTAMKDQIKVLRTKAYGRG